ncbi:MAG: AlwI family type II restriction endonuclease [Ruminococcus flavefaciens]|nr:AlwI family type II restriction endonuclease [Ruminococcus flavefaciens]
MSIEDISYRSFCWSLGTTSFRTKNFNLTIERQLQLLDSFWQKADAHGVCWSNNNILQEKYYLFMKENNFVKGDAQRKDKDAREKTSGLVDIGLIDSERHLTEAGESLLKISLDSDFESDNSLQIAKDSFIYFKQLLKTSNNVDGDIVRPYIVLAYLLSELDYLTKEEFTYLLPLCTTKEKTIYIKGKINSIRSKGGCIDEIIISTLMQMDNYKLALNELLNNQVDEKLICTIGINRKSRQYDAPYYQLYLELKKLYLDNDIDNAINVFKALDKIKIKNLWKKTLFNTVSKKAIEKILISA